MTDEFIVDALQRAVSAVDRAKVPDDLRAEAFRAIWQHMADQQSSKPRHEDVPGENATAQPKPSAADAWTALSARLSGATTEDLQAIYELEDDGTFTIHIATNKLPKTKSEATRALALLVCAGRQPVVEEWTPGEAIIEICKHYGKFDSPNNAAIMADGGEYWQTAGKGRTRKYKLRKTGWEAAAALIESIAEG